MTIQTGDSIPDVSVQLINGEITSCHTAGLFANRKIVMFGVPGAFTPTCSNKHLPGYIAQFHEFQAHDIDVICLSVNDAFVMQAWAAAQQVPAGLQLLADGNAAFTLALGLELDGSAYGMGLRARRFALHAESGVVKRVLIEAPGELRVSSAAAMLAAVTKPD